MMRWQRKFSRWSFCAVEMVLPLSRKRSVMSRTAVRRPSVCFVQRVESLMVSKSRRGQKSGDSGIGCEREAVWCGSVLQWFR